MLPKVVPTVVGVAGVAACTLSAVAPHLRHAPIAAADVAIHVSVAAGFIGAGVVALWRRPENRIGLLMAAVGFLWLVGDLGWTRTALPWTIAITYNTTYQVVLGHLALAFPTGRLSTRLERWTIGSAYAWNLLNNLLSSTVTNPRTIDCPECPRNVLLVHDDHALAHTIDNVTGWISAVVMLLVMAVIVLRWRAASQAARRVMSPVLYAVPTAAIALLGGQLADDIGVSGFAARLWFNIAPVGLLTLPVGFLIGVLRTRLSYGGMAQLLHDLDGAQAHGKVRDALARTLHDPSLELFYWSPAVDGYVDFSGALHDPAPRPGRVMRPIAGDDGPLALLMLDEAAADETQLVDVTVVAARLALENERLQAEVRSQLVALRSATARIVDTGARERRRIERDLHDGAQQRLLAVSMELGAARAKLATIDDPAARGALDRAAAEVQQAITELRDLARGIYPMLLTQEGLGSAVRALAEQSPLPVDVTATDRRYPAAVEAAGYFVIAESVTNAVRHSGASGVEVRVSEAAGYLVVVVRDDGAGGASLDAGSGLRGLADRVTALDGRFTVSSPAGRGTCVRASLPCD